MTKETEINNKIIAIDTSLKSTVINVDQSMYLLNLVSNFKLLKNIESDYENDISSQQKLNVEQFKLKIIDLFLTNISLGEPITLEEKEKPGLIQRLFKYPYALIGSFLAGITGYLGFTSIFQLIFRITNPISFAVSIATGIAEGGLFIMRDVRSLKPTIGVSLFKAKPLMEIYKQQLTKIKLIQSLVFNEIYINDISSSQYKLYYRFLNMVLEDNNHKNISLKSLYKESPLRKAVKGIITAIDGILCTGSGFFLGKILVGMFAASLLSTPIGIGIGIGVGLFSLATFIIVRKHSIFRSVDKLIGEPRKLITEQNKLEKGKDNFLSRMKRIFKRKLNTEEQDKLISNRMLQIESDKTKHGELIINYGQVKNNNEQLELKVSELTKQVCQLNEGKLKEIENLQSEKRALETKLNKKTINYSGTLPASNDSVIPNNRNKPHSGNGTKFKVKEKKYQYGTTAFFKRHVISNSKKQNDPYMYVEKPLANV